MRLGGGLHRLLLILQQPYLLLHGVQARIQLLHHQAPLIRQLCLATDERVQLALQSVGVQDERLVCLADLCLSARQCRIHGLRRYSKVLHVMDDLQQRTIARVNGFHFFFAQFDDVALHLQQSVFQLLALLRDALDLLQTFQLILQEVYTLRR